MFLVIFTNCIFSKRNQKILASALYRPTIILSETQEKEELEETNKNESESAAGDEPKAIDFSIFGDITFLLFFISQGKIINGFQLSVMSAPKSGSDNGHKQSRSVPVGFTSNLRHILCWIYGKFTDGCSVC